MGFAGSLYQNAYGWACGKPPRENLIHFQWHARRHLYRDLEQILPQLTGKVLDIGCGDKPYESWLTRADSYLGADVAATSKADVVLDPKTAWPFPDSSFDGVICTQALQYAGDLPGLIGELTRVLKPEGRLVISVPFAYNQHAILNDYWRFSKIGIEQLLGKFYEMEEIRSQGAVGSTMATLLLNWCDVSLSRSAFARVMKGVFLPAWIVACLFVNLTAVLVDRLDSTGLFYHNTLLVARKRSTPK
jgi:SAM-dependent methyltransferase